MAVQAPDGRERRRFRVEGTVQGVGFRPWVHGLARRHGLSGFVLNDGRGVVIEVEGAPHAVAALAAGLAADAPPLALVETVISEQVPARGDDGFTVLTSRVAEDTAGAALVPPDAATCGDCLRELFDPTDRRHRYPFITCTCCGPRYTIVRDLPFDRRRTTMAGFDLCPDCRREYEDPDDRRFHAEAIACPACGPRLSIPLADAVAALREGAIVAVKGIGGWHLACDAADEDAVARLRARKSREAKPFAVMTALPDGLVALGEAERALFGSPAAPIVVARRRAGATVADAVAPGSRWLGVFAPYTPLHHLLIHDVGGPLVMTSGNRSNEPIVTSDHDARERLAGIADLFLGNDRPIHRRCEDSVVRAGVPLRRARGYTPAALSLPVRAPDPVLAVGAQLKSTFCIADGGVAHLSGHLGDLDALAAWRAFLADLELYVSTLRRRPGVIAHDLHPDYRSTSWAHEQDAELIGVQHHHAHAAACLAEHGRTDTVLAVVLDGTGFGADGTLWGGELLRCDLAACERVSSLRPVPMPGGEAAVRETWRMAAAYLEEADRPVPWERWRLVRQALTVNAPVTSGAGRLLDAVAALLGVREVITYEGQAAIELELLAGETTAQPYACRVSGSQISGVDLVRHAHDDLAAGRSRREIAAAVHEGLAEAFVAACLTAGEPRTVVLTGGCLANLRLARTLRSRLEDEGFEVLTHRRVPAGDGGIAYGQAAVAARRMSLCA
jgi:hydrogenase maturation protein HypF